jgi:hypothetical protein
MFDGRSELWKSSDDAIALNMGKSEGADARGIDNPAGLILIEIDLECDGT